VHTSLWLGYKLFAVIPVADQRTHETTFRALKITSLVATTGAESAGYDCLVSLAHSMRRSQPEVIRRKHAATAVSCLGMSVIFMFRTPIAVDRPMN